MTHYQHATLGGDWWSIHERCRSLRPECRAVVRAWFDSLTRRVAGVAPGEVNAGTGAKAETDQYDIRPVLLQRDLEVIEAYGVAMAPAAVLVQSDGRIGAGPRYGPDLIRQLVADTPGLAVPPRPVLEIQVVGRGEPAPGIRRPDLEGTIVDLDAYRGEPVLLLFWSPGCVHCQALLPHILAYEQATTRVGLLIISGGSSSVNRDLGFTSPVVLDDDRVIARSFGVTGTPAAVLIGREGTVASDVARGAVAVLDYVNRCHMPVMTLDQTALTSSDDPG